MKVYRMFILILIFTIILTPLFTLSFAEEVESYILEDMWGEKGDGDGKLDEPFGIAIDSENNIYVTDSNNFRVQKFSNVGVFIDKWGSKGTDDGEFDAPYWDGFQFGSPHGIAIDVDDNIYTSELSERIQKFTSDLIFDYKWGTPDNGDDMQLGQPYNIAVDSKGSVFVVNWCGYVKKFTFNESKEIELSAFYGLNSDGEANDYFYGPRGIAVDSEGFVYVADEGYNRIVKLNNNLEYVHEWGTYGTCNGEFNGPYGVTIDSEGDVYVTDTWNHRIQKFDSEGNFITKWDEFMIINEEDGNYSGDRLAVIVDIAVDLEGNVYVTGIEHNRILKFSPTNTKIKVNELIKYYKKGMLEDWFVLNSNIESDSLKMIGKELKHIREMIMDEEIIGDEIYVEMVSLLRRLDDGLIIGDLGKVNNFKQMIYYLMLDYQPCGVEY